MQNPNPIHIRYDQSTKLGNRLERSQIDQEGSYEPQEIGRSERWWQAVSLRTVETTIIRVCIDAENGSSGQRGEEEYKDAKLTRCDTIVMGLASYLVTAVKLVT
ncbi:hypothetical protein TorRG33x02_079360 [Trema orientale]|uniref:Uncharacterized protein n=1 Tax=Trema orientale TaxID=63057 RepID=A0A2P5FEX6_TREOI|nr:hypothetical protein TorRG33x02_079360 [Trema orientale]